MRGLRTDRTAQVVIAGHVLVQNLGRAHYDLGVDARRALRVAAAFSVDLVPCPRVHARRVVVNQATPARARRSRTRAHSGGPAPPRRTARRAPPPDPSLDQPCRPTLVMSCRFRTRHTYDGHDEAEGWT